MEKLAVHGSGVGVSTPLRRRPPASGPPGHPRVGVAGAAPGAGLRRRHRAARRYRCCAAHPAGRGVRRKQNPTSPPRWRRQSGGCRRRCTRRQPGTRSGVAGVTHRGDPEDALIVPHTQENAESRGATQFDRLDACVVHHLVRSFRIPQVCPAAAGSHREGGAAGKGEPMARETTTPPPTRGHGRTQSQATVAIPARHRGTHRPRGVRSKAISGTRAPRIVP